MTSTDIPLSTDDVVSCLEDWGRTYPPSRFMVYSVTDDPAGGHDGYILAWGFAFPDKVYVHTAHSGSSGRFSSVDSMRRIMFRRGRDIRLLWIDREPGD
jgi:hypothetical protein